jgi:hypothetical protein
MAAWLFRQSQSTRPPVCVAQLASPREPKTSSWWYACDRAFSANALRDHPKWLGSQLTFARRGVLPAREILPRGQALYYRAVELTMRVAAWFFKTPIESAGPQ